MCLLSQEHDTLLLRTEWAGVQLGWRGVVKDVIKETRIGVFMDFLNTSYAQRNT
jgi:hypothetical protein